MLSSQVMGQVRKLAAEVSDREGVQLYDLEFVGRGGQRTLRVYLHNENSGVSIDDCANVSRGLSLLLDVEDLIPGERYELEVSTPGLDRPLNLDWHYTSAIGQKIKVRTNAPIPGTESRPMKQVKGVLKSFEEGQLLVEADKGEMRIPLDIVHRANVVYEFETPKKPDGKSKKKSKRKD